MANRLQLRKGTTAQNTAFTGAIGELTYDTEKKQLRVHDGSTVGGKIIDDTARDVTGQVKQATETLAGKAKIATTAIAQAGTNDTDIITAKKLRDALNASGTAPVYAIRAIAQGNSDAVSPVLTRKLNISTVTKLDHLNLKFTFTTPMSDTNYIVIGLGSDQVLNTLGIGGSFVDYDKTTTGFTVRFSYSSYASKEDAYSYRIIVL